MQQSTTLSEQRKKQIYETLRRQCLSLAALLYELATGEKPPDKGRG